MNISFIPNRPHVGLEAPGAKPVAREKAADGRPESSLNIVEDALGGLGGVDATSDPVLDAAMTRHDPLGKLFARIFNQPAPPMPAFHSA